MKNYVVDRVEGGFAVLEASAGHMENIPLHKLPQGVKEGDVLSFDEENGTFSIDASATQERAAKIKELMDGLFQ